MKKKTQLEDLEKTVRDLEEKLKRAEADRAALQEREARVRDTLNTILPSLQQLQLGAVPCANPAPSDTTLTDIHPVRSPLNPIQPHNAISQAQPTEWWNTPVPGLGFAGHPTTSIVDWSPSGLDDPLLMASTIRMSDLDDFSFTLSNITALPSPPPRPEEQNGSTPTSALSPDTLRLNRLQANSIRSSRPIWAITPAFTQPTSNVDNLIFSLINKATPVSSSGNHPQEFTATTFPSIMSLLNPSDPTTSDSHPVSSTIAKHVARVVTVSTLPEKIALLYVLCLLVRWQICPTQSHYEALPSHFRPTSLQLLREYPFWVSTIAWPDARDRIIEHMDFTEYDVFARTINKTFTVNWSYGLAAILQSDDEGGFVLSKRFLEHVRELRNWTVERELVDAFGFLDGVVNLR